MQALSDQQKIYGIAGALVMLAGTLVGFSAGVLFAMFDVSPSALVTILIMGAIGFFVGITVATPQ